MSQRIRPTRSASRAGEKPPRHSPPGPRRDRAAARRQAALAGRGFTLVELLVVMVIISILLGFILNAGFEAVRSAQRRQTQALITKLDLALSDRLDALMLTRPNPNTAHNFMADVFNSNYASPIPGYTRAQVWAWYDYIKSEMPDTFFVQTQYDSNYPINFTGQPYPTVGVSSPVTGLPANYVLPMGNAVSPVNGIVIGDGGYLPTGSLGQGAFNPAGTGVYGASYAAAAGIYKNLGYAPQGYDGVDNNSNGLIDEMQEGAPQGSANYTTVMQNLQNHTHNTARAEVLYAILVEGRGPLGSVFNKDDFTDREVQDTDQDGLPEFIDAWGNPLQFFRWPIMYHSDVQRGQVIVSTSENSWQLLPPYDNPAAPGSLLSGLVDREQDPLDVNQQLVAPAWWLGTYNNNLPVGSIGSWPGTAASSTFGASMNAQAFEYYFHRLTEPYPASSGNAPNLWDRSGGGRRAYYSKFLILSGGQDGTPGVFLYSDAVLQGFGQQASFPLIANENSALPFSVNDFCDLSQNAIYSSKTISYNPSNNPQLPNSSDLLQAAQDDITNHNIQTTVAIGGGG